MALLSRGHSPPPPKSWKAAAVVQGRGGSSAAQGSWEATRGGRGAETVLKVLDVPSPSHNLTFSLGRFWEFPSSAAATKRRGQMG